jgi:hypothetical protein
MNEYQQVPRQTANELRYLNIQESRHFNFPHKARSIANGNRNGNVAFAGVALRVVVG